MNRTCLVIIALALLITMAGGASLLAADTTARIDVNSAYVWRGITYNDGLVVQPSIDIASPMGIGINVWGNFNVDDYNGAYLKNEFSEIDLTLSYSKSVGPVNLGIGCSQYLYPHQSDASGGPARGSREAYASAGMDLIAGFSAAANGYYGLDGVKAFYGSLGLTYGVDIIKEKLNAKLSASAGYAEEDWAVGNSGGTKGGLHDYNFLATATYKVTGNLGVGANVGYTGTLDEDVLPEQKVDVYGGGSVSLSF
jgi:uncharacterized protein (TIGR02001 family)